MTEQLYLNDAYLKECEATVLDIVTYPGQIAIILDKTCLQPSHRDGGDKGLLVTEEGNVINIDKVVIDQSSGKIEHRTRFHGTIPFGMRVKCEVDWNSRYRLMRKHTGNHLLYGCAKLLLRRGFAAVSKTTLGDTYSQWLGQSNSIDEELVKEVFRMANRIIREGRNVTIDTLPRQEALEKCGTYLNTILPWSLAELRVVTIEAIDSNPCIGLHVKNVREIQGINLVKVIREGDDIKVYSDLE